MSTQSVLLIATHNQGKVREFSELLHELPYKLLTISDFPEIIPVVETGATFVENAKLKASAYARQTRFPTLADDSGLEIDALGGKPGIRSARYLGDQASHVERMEALLEELRETHSANRRARFVSAIAIAEIDGTIKNLSMGICEGAIAPEPRGEGGFGYDPIFIPDGFHLTFAELSDEIKNKISHRARALQRATIYLRALTRRSTAR